MWVIRQRLADPGSLQRIYQRDMQFAKTILSLDFVFLFFNFPLGLYIVLTSYITLTPGTNEYFIWVENVQFYLFYLI